MKIVLVNPDIPWNAGNIGRSCVATGTELVFVGKMGFNLSDKEIRRSGLDYWQFLKYSVFKTFDEFLAAQPADSLPVSRAPVELLAIEYQVWSCFLDDIGGSRYLTSPLRCLSRNTDCIANMHRTQTARSAPTCWQAYSN